MGWNLKKTAGILLLSITLPCRSVGGFRPRRSIQFNRAIISKNVTWKDPLTETFIIPNDGMAQVSEDFLLLRKKQKAAAE